MHNLPAILVSSQFPEGSGCLPQRLAHRDARFTLPTPEEVRRGLTVLDDRMLPSRRGHRPYHPGFFPARGRNYPDGTHWLWSAMTRYGKSKTILARVLVPAAKSRKCAIVLFDAPGTLDEEYFRHLAYHGHAPRVLRDQLARTDLTPGYDWVSASTDDDPLQRLAFNEESRDRFKFMLMAREDKKDTTQNPNIDEGLDLLLDLHLNQRPGTVSPLYWYHRALVKEAAEHKLVVANCMIEELQRKAVEFAHLPPQLWEMKCAPAQKRLRAVCRKVSFMTRTPATFNFRAFLRGNEHGPGILLVSGASRGNLSKEAVRVMMSSLMMKLFDEIATGLDVPVLMVVDEGHKAGLLNANVTDALATLAKYGLSIHLLVQNIASLPEDICSDILGNTYHAWGRQSASAARIAAEDIAVPLLDPDKVKYEEERWQQFWNGHEFRPTKSVSKRRDAEGKTHETVSEGEQALSSYRLEKFIIKHYKPYDEQLQDVQQVLMNLGKGYWLIRDEMVTPQPVYVPLPKEPFGKYPALAHTSYDEAMRTVLANGAYRKPVILEAACNSEIERKYQALKNRFLGRSARPSGSPPTRARRGTATSTR